MKINSGAVFGPYTIDKILSKHGGMSRVYLAYESDRPDYKAALKVHLTNHENTAAFQDLLRFEAQLLRQLRHPGIVHIFPLHISKPVAYTARAIQQDSKPWYYAMEYIQGQSLDTHLTQIKKYSMTWIMELFYQILLAVDFLHNSGYAHCDIKPQNIMFRHKPDPSQTPAPILVDFGSATNLKRGMVQLAPSLRYSPPEVILAMNRKDISPRELIPDPRKIDIWSLGATLFEIVTGRPLINRRRKKEISTSILRGRLDSMRSQRQDVHESLDKLLAVMLRPAENDRPTTTELITAVEEKISSIKPPRISG